MARRQCKTCQSWRTGGQMFCSDECSVTARQIDEAHAGELSRFRTLPEAHLPYGWSERPAASVLISGIVFPWAERAVLLRRRLRT